MPTTIVRLLVAAAILVAPGAALAHPGHGAELGLYAGLAHPWSGIDHVLAMTAVGLLAARLGGRALWAVPSVSA
jgi:urease accessory protein